MSNYRIANFKKSNLALPKREFVMTSFTDSREAWAASDQIRIA